MLSKMPSNLDLVLAAVAIAALMGFVERGHSISIDPPDQVALEAPVTSCVEIEHARGAAATPTVFPEDLFVSGLIGRPPVELPSAACER
jgi:hypothetical protein